MESDNLENMAKREKSADKPKKAKKDSRIKQMFLVYKMTVREDPKSFWWMLLGFLGPIVIGVALGLLLSAGGWLGLVLWIVAGVLGGILGFLLVLGRRAERAAFKQIAGQPGAVGAVLKNALPRGWMGSEMPVAISPRTQDAVFRAVGKGGVVLIGEGPISRTQKMMDDERRKVQKILPNIPITLLHVGPDEESIELHRIRKHMRGIKRSISKAEVYAVNNRLTSLGKATLPIPKGIDPLRARPQRGRM